MEVLAKISQIFESGETELALALCQSQSVKVSELTVDFSKIMKPVFPNTTSSVFKASIKTASGTRAVSIVSFNIAVPNNYELAIISSDGSYCNDKKTRAVFARYPKNKKYYTVLEGLTSIEILKIIEEL